MLRYDIQRLEVRSEGTPGEKKEGLLTETHLKGEHTPPSGAGTLSILGGFQGGTANGQKG